MSSAHNGATFPVSQRDAFLMPSGPNPQVDDDYHLFVVLTDPGKHSDVLMANASTVHAGVSHDTTCLLQVGDHPFIKQTSYIVYARTRIFPVARLRTLVAAQTIIYRPPPVTPHVLSKICAGIGCVNIDPAHTTFYNNYK